MSDTKQCPFCAEDIKAAAIKCKHCGEMLSESSPQAAEEAPSPAEVAPEALGTAIAADAQALRESTIYEKNGITVTPKVLKTPNASFQMANLSSVQAIDGKAGAAFMGYGCGGCSGLFGLTVMMAMFNAFEQSAGLGFTYILVGAAAVGVGFALVSTAGKGNHWSVNVDKGNNTPVALQANMTEADAKELEAAVNEAFTRLRTSN